MSENGQMQGPTWSEYPTGGGRGLSFIQIVYRAGWMKARPGLEVSD